MSLAVIVPSEFLALGEVCSIASEVAVVILTDAIARQHLAHEFGSQRIRVVSSR